MELGMEDKKLLVTSLGVAVAWVAASLALKLLALRTSIRLLICAAPIALLILQLLVILRYVRKQDELHRRISLEALALAFPIGLLGIFILGFIMKSGVAMPLDFMDAGYLLIAGYVAGYLLAYRRYR